MDLDRNVRSGTVLMVLFAISGFAGLIYESIWTQYLGLFLGHAAYAQSFVLVLFMGGMALGAWLASRCTERLARPLAAYAAIELVVGVLAVAFHPLYRLVTDAAYEHLFPALGAGIGLDLTRYLIATLLIGAQCVLLGATFPLMSAGYLRLVPTSGGRVLAGLYFSNSFGAAIGALTATFVLLPLVGLPGAIKVGGVLSILVALAVWPHARSSSTAQRASPASASEAVAPWLILAAAAITGATSFVYEITWVRMLALALGTTLHAFELMLAAFISGIAFGGLWLRYRADRLKDVLGAAGWAQVCMGIAALGSLFVYMHAFDWVAWLIQAAGKTEQGYALFNVASGAISLAVMFPAAFFAGMTLPLLTLVLLRSGAGERAIGRVYAANTIGAIVGVLVTVHVLMPALGVRVALWLAAILDLALGIYLLARGLRGWTAHRARACIAFAVSVLIAVVALLSTRVDPLTLASSVYRIGRAELPEGSKMLFYGDGKTASVALYEAPGIEGHRSIATNGKVDAAITTLWGAPTSPDEFTMTLAAAIPLAMSPDPKSVAVIGFGSGMTAHTFLGSDRVEHMDVVEIEPLMVAASHNFGERVARVYSDPRANIVIDDAKAYLAGGARIYDVIVSEPSNPWMGGTAALFSEEFYRFIPKHLSADGIFVQWLQLYEISPDLVASVLKAMLLRFSDVQAYLTNRSDVLLVATPNGKLPSTPNIVDRDPRLKAELARIDVRSDADLREFYLLDKASLQAIASTGKLPANSDYFPILQLEAPKARFMNLSAQDVPAMQIAPWPMLEVIAGYAPMPVSRDMALVPSTAWRDSGYRIARELRSALLANAPVFAQYTHDDLLAKFNVVQAIARGCQFDKAGGEWIEASAAVAGATIPYLRAEDLHGVWIEPAWLGACRISNPQVDQVLRFHAAVGARDWQRVASEGIALLSDPRTSGLNAFRSYALGATELAALALGDFEAVPRIEASFGSSVRGFELERRWLLTFAAFHASGSGDEPGR
jgi:predicted membrane-bound spermidine synthase